MEDMYTPVDQYENGLEKIIANLRQLNFLKVHKVYSDELQLLEDATYQVLTETGLFNAVGIQLDNLGEFLDVPRQGQGDEIYRTALKTAIFQKTRHGGIEDLISVAKVNIPSATRVLVDEYQPATAIITVEVPDQTAVTNGALINESIIQAKQAGVEVDIGISTEGRGFKFSNLTGQFTTGRGFSNSATGNGQGLFSTVLE